MPTATFKATLVRVIDSQNPASPSAGYAVGPNGNTGSQKGRMYRCLLEFNLNNNPQSGPPIGPGANVTTADLIRYVTTYIGDVAFPARVDRCTRPFTVNATWNKYDGVNDWTTPGGDVDTPSMLYTSPDGDQGDHAITGMVDFVTDALANRAGIVRLLLRATDETTTDAHQYQAEHSFAGREPRLAVTFEGFATDVMEPGIRTIPGSRPARSARAARGAPPAAPARPAR